MSHVIWNRFCIGPQRVNRGGGWPANQFKGKSHIFSVAWVGVPSFDLKPLPELKDEYR